VAAKGEEEDMPSEEKVHFVYHIICDNFRSIAEQGEQHGVVALTQCGCR